MKIGYTEFSFGYAFTENLIRGSSVAPLGAPIFPNLVQEATAGYDVRIDLPGVPFFFQYKLPELMRKSTASEISTSGAPVSVPFFRMPLMRRDISRQHQILIDWESRYPDRVYYASPELEDQTQFNRAYNSAEVHTRSALFSPVEIGPLPDNKHHTVAYEQGASTAYFCSETKRIHAKRYEDVENMARISFENQKFQNLEGVSRALRSEVRSHVGPSMRELEVAIEQRVRARRSQVNGPSIGPADSIGRRKEQTIVDLLVAREMARVDLAADIFVAQPRS